DARYDEKQVAARTNLPFPVDSFVGRTRELAVVGKLVGESRLVTITGAAGIGKTRLAVEVASGLSDTFEDGAWMVDLVPVRAGGLIAQSVAAALGVREVAGLELLETLAAYIDGRHMLVVLDNCEHLIDSCVDFADKALGACPRLSLLCTSREPLAIGGERLFALGPLAGAGPEVSSSDWTTIPAEAATLFLDRARIADPTFALTPERAPAIAEICRQAACIPLAIELAAGRVGSLSLDEIAHRPHEGLAALAGDGRSPVERHHKMQIALDWSHDLLSQAEQALLRRLSVFTGGCSADAAAEVCSGGPVEAEAVVDHLASLVSKSLVVAANRGSGIRYLMFESVRVYAAEHLRAAEEAEAWAERHGRWCIGLAERADAGLTGPDQLEWLERLDAEVDNIRAALGRVLSERRGEQALRLAGGLVIFWRLRGYWTEGRRWLGGALELGAEAPVALRAKAMWGAGFLSLMLGESDARHLLEESLELAEEQGDPTQVARCLLLLANIAQGDDPSGALVLLQRAVVSARTSNDMWCLGHALGLIGLTQGELGDVAAARSALVECVSVARKASEVQGLRLGLTVLGDLLIMLDDLREAKEPLEEALGIARRLEEPSAIASALCSLGGVAMRQRRFKRAEEHFDEALVLARRLSSPELCCHVLSELSQLAHLIGDLGSARRRFEELIQLAPRTGQSTAFALAGLARVERAEGNVSEASRLYDQAAAAARAEGARRVLAVVLSERADLARLEGEGRAASLLQAEALEISHQMSSWLQLGTCLDAMAALATDAARFEAAARLFAAAENLRKANGGGECAHPEELAIARAALDPQRLGTVWDEGRGLSVAEAVAYACRRTPAPVGPTARWASLTRVERDVASLVAQRLSNAEVAARLFISPRTVSTHLTHIYTKLDLSSRFDLVQEASFAGDTTPENT
ncbi:MAG: tetratricopeptide repeat protein, partial [Acidimicrobiales bacterium]